MTATAPTFRSVCMLTGEVAESPINKILQSANDIAAQAAIAQLAREAFTAAIGFYDCPCGSAFEFDADSTLEDYAALNRWLGHHGRCQFTDSSDATSGDAPERPGASDPPGGRPANPSTN